MYFSVAKLYYSFFHVDASYVVRWLSDCKPGLACSLIVKFSAPKIFHQSRPKIFNIPCLILPKLSCLYWSPTLLNVLTRLKQSRNTVWRYVSNKNYQWCKKWYYCTALKWPMVSIYLKVWIQSLVLFLVIPTSAHPWWVW